MTLPVQAQPLRPEEIPLRDQLLAAANAMLPSLGERRAEGDRDCRLSHATIDEFRQAGFFRVLQPQAFGGLELPAATLFELEIELARADMSAAWVMANMGVAAFHAALFDRQAQEDIWGAKPDAIIASANMPGGRLSRNGEGGFSLSGRWRFSSGIEHADWVILGALLEADGETIAGACLVPRADITIIREWDVAGLRGTGSHGIEIRSANVPAHCFLPHFQRFDGSAAGRRVNTGSLYRLPLPQLLFRSISSASIGGLKGMLDCFVSANRQRTSMMAQRIAQDPHVQALCAEVMADIQAFRNGLVHDFQAMDARGCTGEPADLEQRRLTRLNVTRIAEKCFVHGARLHRAAGASALYCDNPIYRFFNDLLAARQHAANQYEVHARADGAVLFGELREDILL